MGSAVNFDVEQLPPVAAREPAEVRLFCVAYNEALRLPAFLDYYRRLGVGRFFIIDNKSTDGTAELLAAQDDVQTFRTTQSFAAARSGIDWTNRLLAHYGAGHWCLVADADELLAYPDCETVRLPDFCAALERTGARAMQVLLLDMYSDKPMADIGYRAGQNLLQACPYFDGDYRFVPRLVPPWNRAYPPLEPLGGPRTRLFFPKQYGLGAVPRAGIKLVYRMVKPCVNRGWLNPRYLPTAAPQMFKTPLFKGGKGVQLITNHRTVPLPLAKTTGALLHFKYLDDFAAKVAAAVSGGQFFGGSIEYRCYDKRLRRNPQFTFMYSGSKRYDNSTSLIAAGLIRRG